jgi:HSP20 family protein
MSATRWQPAEMWTEMNRLHDEMNRLFGRQGDGRGRQFAASYPAINMWETDEQLVVEAELPGFEMSHLEVSVEAGNQLSIQGDRTQPELEQGSWHRQERGFGKFARVITLPTEVDTEAVEARFKLGVLTIVMPKRAEAKPRRIEVRAE